MLSLRRVLEQVVGAYRSSWRALLGVGLVVYVPLGALDSLSLFDHVEIQSLDDRQGLALLALALAAAVLPLLGTVFYSGVVAAAVMHYREGHRHDLTQLARDLPYARLIVADLALVLVTALGLVLLVVPGFVFLVWFALLAPVVEIENRGVRAAFVRSRALVRRHFWKVAALVWPVSILQSALEGGADELAFRIFGEGFLSDWLGSLVGNLLATPPFALIVVVLFLDLRELEGGC